MFCDDAIFVMSKPRTDQLPCPFSPLHKQMRRSATVHMMHLLRATMTDAFLLVSAVQR
jgi:hypothetical protein